MTPTPSPHDDSARRGYAFALTATMCSGAATVVGKWNLDSISPLLMNALIFSGASVAFLALHLTPRRRRAFRWPDRRSWAWIIAFSALSFLALWTFWAGVQRMDPALASFLSRFNILVTLLLAIAFLGERFDRREAAGALLAVAGVFVMRTTLRADYSAGFWLVLASVACFGATEFVAKLAVRHVAISALSLWRSLLLAIGFWATLTTTGWTWDGLRKVWPGVLVLSLLGPTVARIAYLAALRIIPLSRTAIVGQAQPLFVLLLAAIWLRQVPTLRELAGGMLIASGCLLMIVYRPAHKEPRVHAGRNTRNVILRPGDATPGKAATFTKPKAGTHGMDDHRA